MHAIMCYMHSLSSLLQDIKYSGPDTKNQMVLMPSVKRRSALGAF